MTIELHPQRTIWPAMLTPLNADERPNLDAIDGLVDQFAAQELGGLYILGSTGQWPLLSLTDRRAVAERVVKASNGRLPVIVHVGATASADAVELAQHAESIGADGVSAVAPIYYPTPPAVIFEHYRRIGEASQLPLYVYHLSIVNQMSLATRDYAERILELPNIGGMKITDHDLNDFGLISNVVGDRLQLFSGADPLVCPAAVCGAVGAIGTFYNVWGPATQRARQAFVHGDIEAGQRFTLAFQNAIADVIKTSIWTFLQAAVRARYGIDVGMPRAPVGACDDDWDEEAVAEILERVDNAAPSA